ncbi:MAG: bifunctional lysylphosphatidylglycerol flippase/synthetase MprF, partial [Gaiellaceae bacterium]
MRRPSAPALLGLAAALAGAVGIISALTPELASRYDLVGGVLPPGVPEAARIAALAFGVVLVWVSRSLARRKHRAWKLAIGIVVGSAVAHMAKGLDFEETTATLLLLAALWRWRAEFTVRGDPKTRWPLAQALLALAAVGGLIELRLSDQMRFSERIEEALLVVAAGLATRALYLWLRPFAERARQSGVERSAAEALVAERGEDSLAYFSLRRDKSYLFSASGRSFLAYAVVGGAALVSGEPIGDADEYPELLAEFGRLAATRGWRVAVIGVSAEGLPLYKQLGFRSLYIGDEAIVRPEAFSLEGRAIRKVRQSVTRLAKAGQHVRILAIDDVEEDLRTQIEQVSAAWRGNARERGFSMAMDVLYACPGSVLAVAEDAEGRVDAFIHLVPSPASGGYSLATMRRRPGTTNGLMEFLIVETLAWAKERGVPELSLNFALFGRVLRLDNGCTHRFHRVFRFALLKL